MSRLIPTPVVDKNGRQTTVHKRAEGASSAIGALAGVRPALGSGAQPQEAQHTVKPKRLTHNSPAVRIGNSLGLLDLQDCDDFLEASGRKPVTLPDDVLYEFLRKGIDVQNAAALVNLGLETPDDVPDMDGPILYNLKKVSGTSHCIWTREIDNVVDRLQENGVSAVDASKVLSNGLQDAHLDDALSDDQLIELFSKWTYKSTVGHEKRGHPEQDDVIRGFIRGDIPFDLIDLKMNELKGIEYELNALATESPRTTDAERQFYKKLADRDYFVALAKKAATSVDGYRPMQTLDGLVEKHGMEVMELRNPQMAGLEVHLGNYQSYEVGVEPARYIEQVHDVIDKDTDRGYWMSGDRYTSFGGKQVDRVYVRNSDLLELRDAGLTPEESYDMLVKHKLRPEQIIVARQTGVESTLASGVL